MLGRLTWLAVKIAVAVTIVVAPFGYATTGVHTDVLMGLGCGLAVGVGVGLRGGLRGSPWTGILIGSMVGIVTALIAGLVPFEGPGLLTAPNLALAVACIAGLSGSSLSGYRDMIRETFVLSALFALGLVPAATAQDDLKLLLVPIVLAPWMALIAGILSHRREGWRDARPPLPLLLAAAAVLALVTFAGTQEIHGLSGIPFVLAVACLVIFTLIGLPAVVFLLGRRAIIWLEPRLRVYGQLTDYLRVMWVPIGGFAVGYLTIIVLFAGFYGMLDRFLPGAFADAGGGLAEWLSFAFFTALGQDYTAVVPVSVSARALVGVHLILSAGWALVLFAAVMSSIGPKLDRIARHLAKEDGE